MRASSFALVAALSIAPGLAHAAAGDWAKSQASGRFGGRVEARTWGLRLSVFGEKTSNEREVSLVRDGGTMHMRLTEADSLGPGKPFTADVRGVIHETRTTAEGDTVLKVKFDRRASTELRMTKLLEPLMVDLPIKAHVTEATLTFKKDGTLAVGEKSTMIRDHAYSLYAPVHATALNAFMAKTTKSHAKGVLAPLP